MLFKVLAVIYGFCVSLFPANFRDEFGDELKSVFEAMLKDAMRSGGWSVAAVCLRELRDLPVNLLRAYLEKKHIIGLLHSQPVRFAWKGAFGFGLSFGLIIGLEAVLESWFFQSVIFQPPLFYLFVQPKYQFWLALASQLIPWAVLSIISGLLFAAFFAGKGQFRRFALWGAVCWFIPDMIFSIISEGQAYFFWFNSEVYNSDIFFHISNVFYSVLTGVLLGVALGLLTKLKWKKIALVMLGGTLYPLGVLIPVFPVSFQDNIRGTFLFETYIRPIIFGFVNGSQTGIIFGIMMGIMLGWGKKEKI
ncbi:hypothetical protein EG832_16875 [bacterium]|nr:hypothetical protein [bacterium]